MQKLSLEDAIKYSEGMETAETPLQVERLALALKTLAEAGDEPHFRKVIDSYVQRARTENLAGHEDPLSFLEWMCASLDHSFTKVGYEAILNRAGIIRPALPLETTQKFFRELYGEHFHYFNPANS